MHRASKISWYADFCVCSQHKTETVMVPAKTESDWGRRMGSERDAKI